MLLLHAIMLPFMIQSNTSHHMNNVMNPNVKCKTKLVNELCPYFWMNKENSFEKQSLCNA